MITLELGYVRSLWSLCSVDNLELYLSALVKGFETLHVKAGVVNENIVSLLVTDICMNAANVLELSVVFRPGKMACPDPLSERRGQGAGLFFRR